VARGESQGLGRLSWGRGCPRTDNGDEGAEMGAEMRKEWTRIGLERLDSVID